MKARAIHALIFLNGFLLAAPPPSVSPYAETPGSNRADSNQPRFGVVIIVPSDGTPGAIKASRPNSQPGMIQSLRWGRNILPIGSWNLECTFANGTLRTNVYLSAGDVISYQPLTPDLPWTLTLRTRRLPFEVYSPGRYLFTAHDPVAILTNLPAGPTELGFRSGDYWARGSWPGKPGVPIDYTIPFQNRASAPWLAGAMGLIPGLDLAVHRPPHPVAANTLSALIFYSALTALVVARGQDIRGVDNATTLIPVGWVWALLAGGSLTHGFFCWQSALGEDAETAKFFKP